LNSKENAPRRRLVYGITAVLIIVLALSTFTYLTNQHAISPSPTRNPTSTPTLATTSQAASTPTPVPTSTLYPTTPTFIQNVLLQEGNTQPQTKIPLKPSLELENNGIGADADGWLWDEGALAIISALGLKWIRIGFWSGFYGQSPLTWQWVLREPGVYEIETNADELITRLSENGVNVVLNLGCGMGMNVSGSDKTQWGDVGWGVLGDNEPEWWFKTQEERDKFTEFVQFMAQHFKGRIKYYEIWNEPNCGENPGDRRGGITLADYRSLLKQVAVAIKKEDPGAKVIAGAIGGFTEYNRDWLLGMLKDGVAPLVDYVSWHPYYSESPYTDAMFGVNPEDFGRTSWKNYAANVDEFRFEASHLGFRGGFMVEEMVWRVKEDGEWTTELALYTNIEAGKYTARGIIMNLNLNLTMVSNQIPPYGYEDQQLRQYVKQILCTVVSGAKPANISLRLESNAENLKNATFVLSNGDLLVALWNDVIAEDNSIPQKTNLTINGFYGQNVVGVDTLNGFQQQLEAHLQGGNVIINNLLVSDYPMIVIIKK
jgi:hypothetical protein